MEKWYVIQVRTGYEEKIKESCLCLIDRKVLKSSFIPYFTKVKKIKGSWIKQKEILFKGYVFLISDNVEELYQELKKIPDITKMLGRQNEEINSLREEEIIFLKTFGDESNIIDMSIGYIEGQKIIVTKGPLQGKEGMIIKVDRHKRLAYLEIEFIGKVITAKVGLEIIAKNI